MDLLPPDYKPFGYIDVMSSDGAKVDSCYEIGKTWITIGYEPGNDIRIKDTRQVDSIHCGITIVPSKTKESYQLYLRLLTKKKSSVSGLDLEPNQTEVQLNPSNATFSIGTRQIKWRVFNETQNCTIFSKPNGIIRIIPGLLLPLVKRNYFTNNSKTNLRIEVLRKAYENSLTSQKKARKFTSEKKYDFGIIPISPEQNCRKRNGKSVQKPKKLVKAVSKDKIKQKTSSKPRTGVSYDNTDSNSTKAPFTDQVLSCSKDLLSPEQKFSSVCGENYDEFNDEKGNSINSDLKEPELNEFKLHENIFSKTDPPMNVKLVSTFAVDSRISPQRVAFLDESFGLLEIEGMINEKIEQEGQLLNNQTNNEHFNSLDKEVIEKEPFSQISPTEDTEGKKIFNSKAEDVETRIPLEHSMKCYASGATELNQVNTKTLVNKPVKQYMNFAKHERPQNKSISDPYTDYLNWIQRFEKENSARSLISYRPVNRDINDNLSKFLLIHNSESSRSIFENPVKRKGENISSTIGLAQSTEVQVEVTGAYAHRDKDSPFEGTLKELEESDSRLIHNIKIRRIDTSQ